MFGESVDNSRMNRQNEISAGVESRDKLEINGDVAFCFQGQTDRKTEHETVADVGRHAISARDNGDDETDVTAESRRWSWT